MNKELYLLRHGATSLNGLYAGSTDISLSAEGRRQLNGVGRILQSADIEKIFCSPMKRCKETLSLLHLDVSHELNEELREIDFGRWEGLSFAEISKSDPGLIDLWRTTGDSFCFPDGECIKTFNSRVKKFSLRLLAAGEKRILIIAHGGTIRHLLTLFLGLGPEQSGIFTIQPGCFSTIALHGELGTLMALNISAKQR